MLQMNEVNNGNRLQYFDFFRFLQHAELNKQGRIFRRFYSFEQKGWIVLFLVYVGCAEKIESSDGNFFFTSTL